ncbi:MADS box interactor-like [Zea mays]|uniref:MADS box interactor-like n=1 Tax=Zea mays TaxID=4577 RepID=A0A1D6K156_MAIZE|nr:MADS box interactor-like [Zea mays]ONL97503.1 MADS box interactor-like [Zea mays]
MRPLPILEDGFVPHGIMALAQHATLDVWSYPDSWCSYANPILERSHIFIDMLNCYILPSSQNSICFSSCFLSIFKWMVMNLDTYIKYIHQVLYESNNYLKRILIWDRGSSFLFQDINDVRLRKGKRLICSIVAYHDNSFILNRKI